MPDATPPDTRVAPIPLTLLDEHPDNPRIATWGLDELVASLRQLGVLTPCIVRPHGEKRFQILAGHRRARAAAELGWATVPCLVVTATDSAAWKVLLSENIQRRNLNVIEEALAFRKMRANGMTILAIAGVLNCSEHRVSRRLALLELDESYQAEILRGDLNLSEAWTLVAMQRQDEQERQRGPKSGEGTGRTTKWNSHFNTRHPLAAEAETCCDGAGHPGQARLGPACAACWEEAIRDDQHLVTQMDLFPDDPEMVEDRKVAAT